MEQILPWQNMTAVIEPFYPQGGQWPTALSAGDHAAYSLHAALVQPERRCHGRCPVRNRLHAPVCPIIPDSALPDRTTIMNFRHLLEQHQLARQLFKTINRWLAEAGVMMTKGTLVDATIIEAPSSTKNKRAATRSGDASDQERQSVALWHEGPHWCRCQEWLTHSLVTTAANEHDLNQLGNLLHGRSNLSQPMPATKERHSARSWPRWMDWLIAERPGKVKLFEAASAQEQNGHQHRIHESQHPCQGGAPFRIIKRQFGFVKARYKGLLKNDNQLAMLFTQPACFGWTK